MNLGINVDKGMFSAAFTLPDGRLVCVEGANNGRMQYEVGRVGITNMVKDLNNKIKLLEDFEFELQTIVAHYSFPDNMPENERNEIKGTFRSNGIGSSSEWIGKEDRTLLSIFAYRNINTDSKIGNGKALVIYVGKDTIDFRRFSMLGGLLPSANIELFEDDREMFRDRHRVKESISSDEIHKKQDMVDDFLEGINAVIAFDSCKNTGFTNDELTRELKSCLHRKSDNIIYLNDDVDYPALGAALMNNNMELPFWMGSLTDIELDFVTSNSKESNNVVKKLKEFDNNPCIKADEYCNKRGELRLTEKYRTNGIGMERMIYTKRLNYNENIKKIKFGFRLGGVLFVEENELVKDEKKIF